MVVNMAKTSSSVLPSWLSSVESNVKKFANKNGLLLKWSDRQLAAAFEVGCFHALIEFYEGQSYTLSMVNIRDGAFRYLTSPSGNPANFSYIFARGDDGDYEIRQQVRIESHIDSDIAFTPDIVVVRRSAVILESTDENYASGKRRYFRVMSSDVLSAHECKSMNPFPELMVSFIGMFIAAHQWYPNELTVQRSEDSGHLAPTLFIGGAPRGLHQKMISAMQKSFPLNIICGMHEGTWNLRKAKNRLRSK